MSYKFSQPGAEIQNILDLAKLQIAAPYDAGTSYTAGMYCTKDDGFYVANASTSGTWDGSKWTAVTVGDVLTSINTNLTNINSSYTSDLNLSTVNVASATWTILDQRSYSAGTYLFVCGVAFDTNSTGLRALDMGTPGSSSHGRTSPMYQATSNQTRFQLVRLLEFTSTTEFCLWGYQNSGSQITVYPYVTYIKLV